MTEGFGHDGEHEDALLGHDEGNEDMLLGQHREHQDAPMLEIEYWLPITKVAVTATVVTAKHKSRAEPTVKATPAVVSIVTRPDYGVGYRLTLPVQDWAKLHTKIDLTPDGRMSGVESSTEHHHWDELGSLVGLGTFGAVAGFMIGGPVGAIVGGGISTAGVAAGVAIEEKLHRANLVRDDGAPVRELQHSRAAPSTVMIDEQYHRGLASVLRDLRVGEAHALLDFAERAADPSDDGADGPSLSDLEHRLRLVRKELARSESDYQKWLDTQITTTTAVYDLEVRLSDLPTKAKAPGWLKGDKTSGTDVSNLRALCEALNIAITCDLIDVAAPTSAQPRIDNVGTDESVCYRVMRPAIVGTYGVTTVDEKMELQLKTVTRIVAALPGNERRVPLRIPDSDDRAIVTAFDVSGALTSISSDATSSQVAAAKALGAVPGEAKDAFDAATDVAAPFTAAGRAKQLQDQLAEQKARAALSPAPDPLQSLKDQVAQAELQARLGAANRGTSDPTATAIIVIGDVSAP